MSSYPMNQDPATIEGYDPNDNMHVQMREFWSRLRAFEQQPQPSQAAPPWLAEFGAQISNLVGAMSQQRPTQVNTSQVIGTAFAKPQVYKGATGADARRFLAGFSCYAQSTGAQLNTPQGLRIDHLWIHAALGYLQDEAALWATPYLEEIASGTIPFGGSWEQFVKQFKLRFESTDERHDAIESMKRLHCGKDPVGSYASKFKQVAPRTGFSDLDLKERFREHLPPNITHGLIMRNAQDYPYEEYMDAAIKLDHQLRTLHSKPGPAYTPSTGPAFHSGASPADAMDVDATIVAATGHGEDKSFQAWARLMGKKCYGCGKEGAHLPKREHCPHNKSICGHCGRTGHITPCCWAKWAGNPPNPSIRKAAVKATDSTPSPVSVATTVAPSAPAPAPATVAATVSPADDRIGSLERKMDDLMDLLRAGFTSSGN